MDEVEQLLSTHKWPRECRRVAIVSPEERVTTRGPKGDRRTTKNYCQSQAFSRQNKGQAHLREKIEEILPDWFVPGEHFTITVNKDVTCYPHKDPGVGEALERVVIVGRWQNGCVVVVLMVLHTRGAIASNDD